MTQLWIARHGEAEPAARSDAERALTERGWRQARAVGQWLRLQPQMPERIYTSPYRRTRETAAAISAALSLPVAESALLVPEADPVALLSWLEGQANLLLVSHQPLVSALAGLVAEADHRAGPPLGTGSLAVLCSDPLAVGCGRLLTLKHAPELILELDAGSA